MQLNKRFWIHYTERTIFHLFTVVAEFFLLGVVSCGRIFDDDAAAAAVFVVVAVGGFRSDNVSNETFAYIKLFR